MSHDLQFDESHNGVVQPQAPGSDMGGGFNLNQFGGGGGGASGSNSSFGATLGSLGGRMQFPSLTSSAHPTVCAFHCLFKTLALFVYLLGGWFASNGSGGISGANFITVTVVCILLLAADFWVVKNITGRLLVGLRWWNKVEGDTTRWIFESAEVLPDGSEVPRDPFDSNIFWGVLYLTPVIWGLLLFLAVIKFEFGWLMIVFMALSLSCSNTYGYMRCSRDQKERFQRMMESTAQQGALTMFQSSLSGIMTSVTRNLTGINTPGPPQQQQAANPAATFV